MEGHTMSMGTTTSSKVAAEAKLSVGADKAHSYLL